MRKSLNNVIHLEDYRARGTDGSISKVFTGRDRGAHVRRESNLDELENRHDKIIIIIPDQIYSINPSFFEELFINAVLKLGKEQFLEKFEFKTEGNYVYERPLMEAIQRIVRKKTALG